MSEGAVVAILLFVLTIDGLLYALDGARKRQIESLALALDALTERFEKLRNDCCATSRRVDALDQTADRNRRWGRR